MSSLESFTTNGWNPLRLWCTALTFLTRLPFVARLSYSSQEAIARSALFWPLVGVLIGGLSFLAYVFGLYYWGANVAAVFAIAASAVITGAFHEDGLADSADGFYGGYNAQRRLEIMKDSRIGTFGGLALVLVTSALIVSLQSILAPIVALALVWAHALGRMSSLCLTLTLPYVRFEGTNKPIASSMSLHVVLTAAISCLGIAGFCYLYHPDALQKLALSTLACLCFWPLAGLYARHKIGGITGDALGAINHLSVLLVLLVFAAR
jgi:adenosylcobinamide-GDP ribazoletransferase